MSEERLAYERLMRKLAEEEKKFWLGVICRNPEALWQLESGRGPDSVILTRLYTKENRPDRTSEAYKEMCDHVEKLYKFDELD